MLSPTSDKADEIQAMEKPDELLADVEKYVMRVKETLPLAGG